jgi:hypothetical protein
MSAPIRPDRRRFLAGPGGAALALPFLPSLFTPREAAAQARSFKCFVDFGTEHGAVRNRDMFPALPATPTTMSYGGHTIRQAPLLPTVANGETRVSALLRAPSTEFSAVLAGKMNVLNGLDVPLYLGHSRGVHLGNFAASDQVSASGASAYARQTIDQIIGWSRSFYGDGTGVRERVIVQGALSYAHADPAARTGTLRQVSSTSSSNQHLFDVLFGTSTTNSGAAQQALLVDQVLASYQQLRNSNARLSAEDRRRLDEHMQRMFELQRKLRSVTALQPPPRPTTNSSAVRDNSAFDRTPGLQTQFMQLYNDILVAAFATGVSRVAAISAREYTFSDYGGGWHQEVAHQHDQRQSAYDLLAAGNRLFFRSVLLDLVRKMDAVSTGDGRTLLDHSLVAWSQEAGNYTHDQISIPVVSFGSAGGVLRTGQYCDYRNLAKYRQRDDGLIDEGQWYGLLWHQWLGSVLQSMGLARSEYEANGVGGWPSARFMDANAGWYYLNGNPAGTYPDSVWNVAGEMLPWLRA